MPDIIIGVITCDKHELWRKACEDTWVKKVTKPYRVVWAAGQHIVGQPEMADGKPDTYHNLPHKIRGLCDYALSMGSDWLVKVDCDTYLYPDRLKVPTRDYAGIKRGPSKPEFVPEGARNVADYCSGGIYWLSKRAMKCIIDARVDDWAEDRWVGNILLENGIYPEHIPDFHSVSHVPVTDYNVDTKLMALTALTEPYEMYLLDEGKDDNSHGGGAHYRSMGPVVRVPREEPEEPSNGAHYKGK